MSTAAVRARAELEYRRRNERAKADGKENNPYAQYRFDPMRYITDKLGWFPWAGDSEHPGQVEVLEAYRLALLQQHERLDYEQGKKTVEELEYWQPGQVIQNYLRIEAGHTVGKCVAASEWLTTAYGRRVQAKDLIGQTFKLKTLVNGNFVTVKAHAAYNATEPVYAITTETGKRIVRNAHHPLWSGQGAFVSGRKPTIKPTGWKALAEFAPGDLVAVAEKIPFPHVHESMTDEQVKMLAYLIGDGGLTNGAVRFSQQDNAQLAEFRHCAEAIGCVVDQVGKYDYIVHGADRRKSRKNAVLSLCRKHDLMGKSALEKRVPPAVFGLQRRQLRLFLSRLYSTDGWACMRSPKSVEIGFSSSSLALIQDVQELLLRFGIHARIYHKTNVRSWSLVIHDRLEALRFCESIGIYGKEKAVEVVRQNCLKRVATYQRAVAERPGRPRWFYCNALPGTRWERVVSVEQVGVEDTVAIEVPGYETYLTTFFEHNTKLASGIVSHFFDTCAPAIIYTFAPTYPQINDLLWKEIRVDRRAKGLPGRVLETPEIKYKENHFAKGRAASNSEGKGTERVQGQHGKYMMLVMDEAEGVADFVFDAIKSMASGGIVIVLLLANPRTRTSKFYKLRENSNVANFRISCLYHPNVLANREIVPGAVRRDYVMSMVEEHAEEVDAHDEDSHTFELPWQPGVIYRPDTEMLFRVLGIPPSNSADDTFVPAGRYEAAKKRIPKPEASEKYWARLGVDVARYGNDMGTLYIRHNGRCWRARQFAQLDTVAYYQGIKAELRKLKEQGVVNVQVRVDGGGGFGAGVIDPLNHDAEIESWFIQFQVLEVHFNGAPHNPKAYDDLVTEMYAEAAETLKGIALVNPPNALEVDLTERKYGWVNREGVNVKRLEKKDDFRKPTRAGHSPDDGDGFVLAVAPDHIFRPPKRGGTWGKRR